jgi:anti-sigma regulatory factor (Ser/Thr protein kinase)
MDGLMRLGLWVDEVAATLCLPATQEYALRLCLEEAVANVAMHGAPEPDAAAEAVSVELRHASGLLHVLVEDRCAAFDPLLQPAPDLAASLEDRPIGGLGIHLMRQYAQSVRYRREAGTNRLELTIAR